MFLLLWISRQYGRRLKNGDVFLIYLIIYPIGRFFLEFLRLDASQVAGLNANQTLMAVVAVVSAAFLILRHIRDGDQTVEENADSAPSGTGESAEVIEGSEIPAVTGPAAPDEGNGAGEPGQTS